MLGSPAPQISVAIICRNNERTIGRTLRSVQGLARQVVVVDSGSTDRTLDIVRAAGAELIEHGWLGFGPQKNYAMEHAAQPWTLFLDSDESVEPDLARAIALAINRDDPAFAGYELNRAIFYAGQLLRYAWRPEWRFRLVRTGQARWSSDAVHESLDLIPEHAGQRIGRLAGDLRHDAIPSVAEHLRKQIDYAQLAAAGTHRNESPISLITSPLGAWLKQMIRRQAWRDGWRGCSAASITAVGSAIKHLVLLEQARTSASKERRDDA